MIISLQQLRTAGKKISGFSVNVAGHAFFREKGQLHFIAALPDGLEFPGGDDHEASTEGS